MVSGVCGVCAVVIVDCLGGGVACEFVLFLCSAHFHELV